MIHIQHVQSAIYLFYKHHGNVLSLYYFLKSLLNLKRLFLKVFGVHFYEPLKAFVTELSQEAMAVQPSI